MSNLTKYLCKIIHVKMLQPSDSPAAHPQRSQYSLNLSEDRREEGKRPKRTTIWKWISVRELVFVFVACSVGAALFQTKDNVRFVPAWKRSVDTSAYHNKQYPMEDEKLPTPIITDLNSDGSTDLLYLTPDYRLVFETFPDPVLNLPSSQPTSPNPSQQEAVNIRKLSESDGSPIAMATGYLKQYQSMVQVRQQVVVVLLSDWTVLCLNHELKLLWKVQPLEKQEDENLAIREASVLIAHVSIRKGDTGCVVVGGRVSKKPAPQDSFTRARRSGGDIGSDKDMLDSFEHYTTVALDGASGNTRWQHTPSDFQVHPAYRPDISSFHHLKLYIHKQLPHEGEVSWHQYSHSLNQILPHSWLRNSDTHFQLAHFKKDRKENSETDVSEHIMKVGELASDHIAGLTFGGMRPHSPDEHVQDPNVLVVHSAEGIGVVHLYQGRPLCSIPLSPYHATHVDVNGDGTVDHVQAVVNPMENMEDEMGCYGQAIPMVAARNKPLFKHSICKATHWTETFIATDKWLPALNKVGRKAVDHDITEPLPPVLLESVYHSSPLKLHFSLTGYSWTRWLAKRNKKDAPAPLPHPKGPVYDSVFVLSSGRVTSIGPKGEFNWQVDTRADWDTASEVIYNAAHPSWNGDPHHVLFLHGTFTPSAQAHSMHSYGKKDHILILGWQFMVVLSGKDGEVATSLRLPCEPIAPPVVADFTEDGWNDVIITCKKQYMGYMMSRQSGFWSTTVLSLFVGVVLTIIAIYTRQRTALHVFPTSKPYQD